MLLEEIRSYCLSKKGVTEDFPFGGDTLVFRVMNKIFLLTGADTPEEDFRINLKCDPEYAIELREKYEDIIPGYHMNKVHWNTVFTNRTLQKKLVCTLIDHSFELIVNSLPKKLKLEWQNL
jgi:predicted DNA-binding protein (MmcQ/YjbR family)